MRQVARRLKDGSLELVEVPEPSPGASDVQVRVAASAISSGTERATLEVARKGLIAKARARPDQARQVVERARRDGIGPTLELVRRRLEELGPLGYSAAGTVETVGERVRGFRPGDRVAIAGAGSANHAEVDVVPALLCAAIPDGVGFHDAAFATLGSIAMHGFRRADVQVGARVGVIGLGLIGQLAVRVARAAGCQVVGVDLRPELVELAVEAGALGVRRDQVAGSDAAGACDAVLVCAATQSSDPVELAAELARDRAPVVIVGDVGMDVPRKPFYEKELDLRLSRSYGPGRYDPEYEVHGHDYPIGYVPWTEQRNMGAFLALVADGKLRPAEIVTHRFPLERAEDAFAALDDGGAIGVVLDYEREPEAGEASQPSVARPSRRTNAARKPRLGVVGAGSFATATLIPGLLKAGFEPVAIVSASGLSAESARQRFEFPHAHADLERLLSEDLDLVAVATQHDSHAAIARACLEQGIGVYVEKPLALSWDELRAVRDAHRGSGAHLFVGFNRRHAPLAAAVRSLSGRRLMAYRVNAGPLPLTSWINDPVRGGGRLKGEGCHFIDFLIDQAGCDPREVIAQGFPSRPELPVAATDNFSVQIDFEDGSVGTVHYAADAPTGPGKERFEVSAKDAYAVIDDFRSGSLWRGRHRQRLARGRQDKGFAAQYALLAEVVRGRAEPPSPDSFVTSTLATLAAARSLETGRAEPVVDGSATVLEPGSAV